MTQKLEGLQKDHAFQKQEAQKHATEQQAKNEQEREEDNKNKLDLQSQFSELKQQVNADNPQIHKMQAQIESLQKELEDLQVNFITTTSALRQRITDEEMDRRGLGRRITNEATARQEADDALGNRITLETTPYIARGYEQTYLKFLNGALIYRPTLESDVGMITLPIRELSNPLKGTFDLSRCGDSGKYLNISTGYRKEEKEEKEENKDKLEIWLAPRFLIEKELNTKAAHFKSLMDNWKQEEAPVRIFWTLSDWDISRYESLTKQTMDEISNNNLYEKWSKEREWISQSKESRKPINILKQQKQKEAKKFRREEARKFRIHFMN